MGNNLAIQVCPIGKESHIADPGASVASLQTTIVAILDLLENLQLMETAAAPAVVAEDVFFDSTTDEFFDSDTDEFFDT
ncbi:MAG: hypothetical protein SWO11_21810 [Thermodesulfobacteriota bacterium]|nr:hypothetical protein [Thermodesulfobacteriota bacterium]